MLPASIHVKQTTVLESELLFLLSGLLQLLVPGRGHNLQLRTSKSTLRRGPQQARQASNNTLACLTLPPSSFRCEIRAHTHTHRKDKPGLIFVVLTFRRLRSLRCPGNDTHSALSEPCRACSLVCCGRLAVPPEELGEATLEEDEVDDEDLATGEGPGVPGEERRRTTL